MNATGNTPDQRPQAPAAELTASATRQLVSALQDPACYPHATGSFHSRETHSAFVILTGEFAYKIKKPVNLGFLDFSTLEKRRFDCTEEVRLNRRLAPSLYPGCVPITGTLQAPVIDGQGPAIEYAVKMRQFSAAGELQQVLAADKLEARHIDQLAGDIAGFHVRIERAAEPQPWGRPALFAQQLFANFEVLATHEFPAPVQADLRALESWCQAALDQLSPCLEQRRQAGYVRECHGDLHLGNIVLIADRLVPFDCLEFSPALRWIDVMSEIAFLLMDLGVHSKPDLAWRFLDRYLEHTGDYEGLRSLRLYSIYRALVRAKVAAIRLGQADLDLDPASRHAAQASLDQHLAWANETAFNTAPPLLLITHGLSGSGKTFLGSGLLEQLPAVRLRSDVIRKQLYPDNLTTGAATGIDAGLYDPHKSAAVYEQLARHTDTLLQSGYTVIVDACFPKLELRERFSRLAEKNHATFRILDLTAPTETLIERIRARNASGQDASDATIAVLRKQLASAAPLTPGEQAMAIQPAGGSAASPHALAGQIRNSTNPNEEPPLPEHPKTRA